MLLSLSDRQLLFSELTCHFYFITFPRHKTYSSPFVLQVEHYRETGFPLAVKLGTITADGKGDVFSYAEDDMVEDPHLSTHLKHFGINVQQLQKVQLLNELES